MSITLFRPLQIEALGGSLVEPNANPPRTQLIIVHLLYARITIISGHVIFVSALDFRKEAAVQQSNPKAATSVR